MSKIIKAENPLSANSSVEAIKYTSLYDAGQPVDDSNGMTPEQMEENDKTFAVCSMLYGLRFLEATRVREKAFQSGYEAGQGAAIKETQDIVDSHLSLHEALKTGLLDMASLKDMILNQAEDDILQLVIAIAKKLVCRELKQHPDTIIDVVEKALKAVKAKEEIIIRIHPDDFLILEQHMGDLKQSLEHIGMDNVSIRIEEAPELTQGGCIIETDTNLIDMSLEVRMESVFSMLSAEQ